MIITYNIEATIFTAIDRAGEAMGEVDGIEITSLPPKDRWIHYSTMLRDMADNWTDTYPLAGELATLNPNVLARLWRDLVG